MDSIFDKKSGAPMYIQLYNYFRKMILSGAMTSGSKLPSIRSCASRFSVSKTTVESAYVQLETEGYIYSVAQSGFFVSEISSIVTENKESDFFKEKEKQPEIIYDFTSSAADESSFDFNLWQRYIKSALRTGDRLLSYGDPQGEEDLRKALCNYVKKSRGIICNENQIVVGAGVQNLLSLLCALEKSRDNVLFLGERYLKGEQIFKDYGREVMCNESYKDYSSYNADIIYTCPSHMNAVGDVMPVSKRIDLLKFAKNNSALIVEDDYNSEFSNIGHPAPSLRSLDSGENVVYIGTFSRLLIPSIRISFMVLTRELSEKYSLVKNLYNQTASKTEQIALCRYISDGQLQSKIKKTKKLYSEKTKRFYDELKSLNGEDVKVGISSSGFTVTITLEKEIQENPQQMFREQGMEIRSFRNEGNQLVLLFSVFSISSELIDESVKNIYKIVKNFKKI